MKQTAQNWSAVLVLALGSFAWPAAQAQTYTYTTLYSFSNTGGDGTNSYGNLVMDPAGNLYGTTAYGGTGNYGTIFKIDPSGVETVLHRFNFTDGSGPKGGLVRDAAGNLYGTTYAGGALGNGTVFKLDTTGTLTVLHSFGQTDGAFPNAGLIMDSAGMLYGTTYLGGAYGSGVVFKVDPSGPTETVLYSFGATAADGIYSNADLVRDSAGNLYGTTTNGGAFSFGTVFKLDPSGNETVLHDFTGADGTYPSSGLLLDPAGKLYGMTNSGGTFNVGTIYSLPSGGGALTVLHHFGAVTPDGARPIGDLIRDAAGNLYGTTESGGVSGLGSAFRLDPAGNLTVLASFNDYVPQGYDPVAGLLMDAAGNLYGTTLFGGANNGPGLVFKLSPQEDLHNFTAEVFVGKEHHTTVATGQFTPTAAIDPVTEPVAFSVAGTNTSSWSFAPGSFHKLFGLYLANATSGSSKIGMLLAPLKNGNWSYSALIQGFLPGSTAVTVSLSIGAQTGTAAVTAHVF